MEYKTYEVILRNENNEKLVEKVSAFNQINAAQIAQKGNEGFVPVFVKEV